MRLSLLKAAQYLFDESRAVFSMWRSCGNIHWSIPGPADIVRHACMATATFALLVRAVSVSCL